MTPEQIQQVKKSWENYVSTEVEKILRAAIGIPQGENYKKYVPISDLIDYKLSRPGIRIPRGETADSYKFKKFIAFIDDFTVMIASQWPFLDMSTISLNWTAEQLIYKIVDMYGKVPVIQCDGIKPEYKDNTEDVKLIVKIIEDAIGPHVNKRKKINKKIRLRETIVDARGITVPTKRTGWGLTDNWQAIAPQIDPIIEKINADIKKAFPNCEFNIDNYYTSINDICKRYESKNIFIE
jgi:hypothetical protein